LKGTSLVLSVLLICFLISAGASSAPRRRVIAGDGYQYPPFAFYGEDGQPAGFNIELARAVGDALGWEIEISLAPWPETMERFSRGEIDFISGMFYTPKRGEEYGFTTRHSVASGDIFSRKGMAVGSVADLGGQAVAVQNDDIVYHYLRELDLNIDFVMVPGISEALHLLALGEADYAAVVTIPAHYAIEREKLANVQANGLHLAPFDYSFIVPREEKALLAELERGLRQVKSSNRYDELYNKWLGPYEKPPNVGERPRHLLLTAVLGTAALVSLIWAFALRRIVRLKTADLSRANNRLLKSQENLHHANEELQAAVEQLTATTDELAEQYRKLQDVEGQLSEEKDLLRTTLLSVGVGVIVTDAFAQVVMINPVAEKLTGWLEGSAIGRYYYEIFPGKHADLAEQVMYTEKTLEIGQQRLASKTGSSAVVTTTAAAILDRGGAVRGAVIVFRDVSDAVRHRSEIEYLSYHDHLTGVFNRRAFSREMERFDQQSYLPLSIIVADVNGLKLANDAFGHAVGDQLLIRIAQILKSAIGERGIIARLGGDEFACLLPNTALAEASGLVAEIEKMVKEEIVHSIQLSVSLGVGVKEKASQNMTDVFNAAEERMYSQKILTSPEQDMVDFIINTLFEKSKGEKEHSYRVAKLSQAVGEALGLPAEKAADLYTTGLMHDIGKVAIDERILHKEEPLSEKEKREIMRHPELGYRILRGAKNMDQTAWHVLAHHEHFDGTGFPKGLRGKEIPLQARIIAVVDAYDDLTTGKAKLSPAEAARKLAAWAGKRLDPQIVAVFLNKVLPQSAAIIEKVDETVGENDDLA